MNNDDASEERTDPDMKQTAVVNDDHAEGSLEEVFKKERDDMRERLRGELKREPTEKELDEWLRQHTEGY